MRTAANLMSLLMFVLSGTALAADPGSEPQFAQVFVSGADGYHTCRIPALLVSGKGTLD